MASWSSFLALSGFAYDAIGSTLTAAPRVPHREFRCFWSTGTGWGTFAFTSIDKDGTRFTLEVLAGRLRVRSCELAGHGRVSRVRAVDKIVTFTTTSRGDLTVVRLETSITLEVGHVLEIEVGR
jgi:non-lysosomal glucosylceramidase